MLAQLKGWNVGVEGIYLHPFCVYIVVAVSISSRRSEQKRKRSEKISEEMEDGGEDGGLDECCAQRKS
jgi:hypothetical protein